MRRAGPAALMLTLGATVLVAMNTASGFAAAQDLGSSSAAYDAYAQGVGIDATATNSKLPLGLVLEGVGPEASSHVTSYGTSDAESSFPYLGPVVPGLFGLAPPLLFGLPPLEYPLEATAGAGQRPSDVDAPGVALHAESGTTSNYSSATVGSDALNGARSTSRVDVDGSGNVTATGTAELNVIKLGNYLSMSDLSSTASVTADATTGQLTRTSSLSIGRITVPGLSITLPATSPTTINIPDPIGGIPQLPPINIPPIPLPFGGQTIPAPDIGFENGSFTITLPGFGSEKFAIPAQPVLSAFKAAGVQLGYQPATNTQTGVQGAEFTFGYTPSIPQNQYFSGPVPITYTMGATSASVTMHPAIGPNSGVGGSTGVVGTGISPTGVVGTGVSPTGNLGVGAPVGNLSGNSGAAPTGALGLPSPSQGSIPVALGNTPSTAAIGGTSGGSAPAVSEQRALSLTASISGDLSNIYIALVLVAAAAFMAMTLLRLMGVQRKWTS